jgi:hypothetical protein
VQLTSRLLRFFIQQPLILVNNLMPQIRLPHIPAHHFFQVSIKLFGLPEIHHIVNGLCGKVVFDPLLPVVFSLNFRFLVAGFKLCMSFEEV